MAKQRVVWIIWDAASKDVVELLLKENKLPNLKIVQDSGISRRVKLHNYNCQTPNALAVQFTGMDTERLNIGGYFTPTFKNEEITAEYHTTFMSSAVAENALWLDLLKEKKKVILSNVPFAGNKGIIENLGLEFTANFNGYEHKVCSEYVIRSEDYKMESCIYDNIPAMRIESRYLNRNVQVFFYNTGSEEGCSVNIEDSRTKQLDLTVGKIYPMKEKCFWIDEYIGFRVYVLKREASNYTVLFTAAYSLEKLKDNTKICLEELKAKTGAFFGESYGRLYRKGYFGKLKADAGDGSAERLYLELSEQLAEYFNEVNYYLMKKLDYDFMLAYQPCIDEVSHEFFGHWKLAHELADPENEHFYLNMLTRIYCAADSYVGKILKLKDENINIIITSDHGMSGVAREFYINEYLRQSGYLKLKEDNTIDIKASALFFHPCNNASLFVNDSYRKLFEDKIQFDLLNLVDVRTSKKPVYKITKMPERSIYGDYYIEGTEGYILCAALSDSAFGDTNKSGMHMSRPDISSMDAIFYASGPAIDKKDDRKLLSNKEIRSEIEK
jgi:hypothetical protein